MFNLINKTEFNIWLNNWSFQVNLNKILKELNLNYISFEILLNIRHLGLSDYVSVKQYLNFELKKKNKINIIYPVDLFILYKIMNNLMLYGNKETTYIILNKVTFMLRSHYKQDPYHLICVAVKKISPTIYLKKLKIAGRNYQIPLFVTLERQLLFGAKLLVQSAKLRKEHTIVLKLFCEIKDILDKNINSISLKKKNDLYKLAIENKFFIKFL